MPELKKPSNPSIPQTNVSKTQNTVDENAKTIKNQIIKTIKNLPDGLKTYPIRDLVNSHLAPSCVNT